LRSTVARGARTRRCAGLLLPVFGAPGSGGSTGKGPGCPHPGAACPRPPRLRLPPCSVAGSVAGSGAGSAGGGVAPRTALQSAGSGMTRLPTEANRARNSCGGTRGLAERLPDSPKPLCCGPCNVDITTSCILRALLAGRSLCATRVHAHRLRRPRLGPAIRLRPQSLDWPPIDSGNRIVILHYYRPVGESSSAPRRAPQPPGHATAPARAARAPPGQGPRARPQRRGRTTGAQPPARLRAPSPPAA
jgi:hypothetical protein